MVTIAITNLSIIKLILIRILLQNLLIKSWRHLQFTLVLQNVRYELSQILLVGYSLQRQIRLAVKFEHLHLLALVAYSLAATSNPVQHLAAALIVYSTDLNVGALPIAL